MNVNKVVIFATRFQNYLKILRNCSASCFLDQESITTTRPFDPSYVSVVEQSKSKKKAAVSKLAKPRTISFVLHDAPVPVVPKGKARKARMSVFHGDHNSPSKDKA